MAGDGVKSDLVDLSVFIREDNSLKEEVAIWDGTMRVDDGPYKGREKWAWLPRSEVELEPQPDGTFIVTMPEWLAVEKGLV